jgi:hypothetical protein
MSNQGDRYVCSDPNCGCEVEIRQPSSTVETLSEVAGSTVRPSGYEYRSEEVSTEDDFGGWQGAGRGGTFGTAGTGDPAALASGRYDTESTRLREPEPRQPAAPTLRCFCGNRMTKVGSQLRAQAAQIPSR